MSKPKLPLDIRRRKVSITLKPSTLRLLDGCANRSELIDNAIVAFCKREAPKRPGA